MSSRFVSTQDLLGARNAPRWFTPLAAATTFAAATVYALVAITQAPRTVEAPGFLTPTDDGRMQVAAYVPRTHPEYAARGRQATVVFPDGTERVASIGDVGHSSNPLPHRELIGDERLGTLVMMRFVDGRSSARGPMVEGLPVKLHFEPRSSQ